MISRLFYEIECLLKKSTLAFWTFLFRQVFYLNIKFWWTTIPQQSLERNILFLKEEKCQTFSTYCNVSHRYHLGNLGSHHIVSQEISKGLNHTKSQDTGLEWLKRKNRATFSTEFDDCTGYQYHIYRITYNAWQHTKFVRLVNRQICKLRSQTYSTIKSLLSTATLTKELALPNVCGLLVDHKWGCELLNYHQLSIQLSLFKTFCALICLHL